MTEPMTPEQIQEIREEVSDYPELASAGTVEELLGEIDYLKGKIDHLEDQMSEMYGALEHARFAYDP